MPEEPEAKEVLPAAADRTTPAADADAGIIDGEERRPIDAAMWLSLYADIPDPEM